MIRYIEGRTLQGESVGSFSVMMGVEIESLDERLFGDCRGNYVHYFEQIPPEVPRKAIAVGLFLAVPVLMQRRGWGRLLFQELTNQMIVDGMTLGIIEVDPFIQWCDSEQHYSNEIAWRSKLYEAMGWNILSNAPGATEVERPFMYIDLSRMRASPVRNLRFSAIDEASHRKHQAESDREYLEDC